MSNVKVTNYKTKMINNRTGGRILDYRIPEYEPFDDQDDGILRNSFVSKNGVYLGDYGRGWWYVKSGFKVCDDHPLGVAEVYKKGVLKGYCGFSHRGYNVFVIGDRLFCKKYVPKMADYTNEQWNQFVADRNQSIETDLENKWYQSRQEAEQKTTLSDVIPFRMHGKVMIETIEQCKEAAINLSEYLS